MKTKYRTQFDISLSDMDTIEKALRKQALQLGDKMLDQRLSSEQDTAADTEQLASRLAAIQSVLGKLHNQKVWFTPKEIVPLG